MATRGQIAYLANPNTIFTTYIHYDAYPQAFRQNTPHLLSIQTMRPKI
jgi:hypothetical protein